MTRAEYRRIMREQEKKIPKQMILTREQITAIKENAAKEASRTAMLLMLAIPVMVLHDKYWTSDRSKKKLQNFVEDCLTLFRKYENGCYELHELQEALEEEAGIKFEITD